jgi:hypothetical protein
MGLASLIAYKLHTVAKDAFGIKQELIRCTQCLAISLVAVLILDFFVEPIIHGIPAAAIVVGMLASLYFSIVVPVKTSYLSSRGKHFSTSTGKIKLFEEFLACEEGYQAFLKFSKKEFCTENVIFWKHCRNFDGTPDEAERIFQLFLKEGR